MSWGPITTQGKPANELADALHAAAADFEHQLQITLEASDAGLDAEATAQVEAGISAASTLAESGAFGDGPYTVTLTGHANPGHQPVAGYAADYLSITVSAASAPDNAAPAPVSDGGATPAPTTEPSPVPDPGTPVSDPSVDPGAATGQGGTAGVLPADAPASPAPDAGAAPADTGWTETPPPTSDPSA